MRKAVRYISFLALALTVVPSLLCFAGLISIEGVKWAALAGTIVWFGVTPIWMGRRLPIDAAEVEI